MPTDIRIYEICIINFHYRSFSVGFNTRHTAINTVVLGFVSFLGLTGFTQPTLQRISTMPSMNKTALYVPI